MKMDNLEIEIETGVGKSLTKVESLISKFKALSNVSQNVSSTMKKVNNNITPVSTEMHNVSKSAENMNKTLSESPRASYNTTYKELQRLEQEYDKVKRAVDSYKETYGASEAGQKMYYNKPIKNLYGNEEAVAPNMAAAEKALSDYEKQIEETKLKLKEFKQQILQGVPLNTKPASKDLERLQRDLDNVDRKVKKTKNSFSLFKGIGSIFSKTSNMFKSFGNNLGKTTDGLLHKIKKLGLGLIAVRTAMSLLTKAVNAYLSFDGELQDSISNSWNMLGSLLAPAIELVAELFATATTYVYMFVKALTGIDLVARANAKSLKTQEKAAKAAAAAQRSLSSMDEITNLQTDPAGTPAPQIEVPQIEPNEFFSNLVDLIKKGDWYGLGKYIAEGLNKAMDSIPWDKIRKTASQVGTNIAQFLNGGIENLNWKKVGSTIGNGINTAIDLSYSFVTTFNWKAFGQGIADLINGAFKTIEWDKLAKTLSEGIKGILKSLNELLTKTDWKEIGKSIREFLKNIDWGGIAKEIFKLIINSFKAEGDILDGLFDTEHNPFGKIDKKQMMGPMGGFLDSLKEFEKYQKDPEKYARELDTKLNGKLVEAKKLFDDVTKSVGDFFGGIGNGIGDFFNNIGKGFDDFLKGAGDFFGGIGNGIAEFFDGIGKGIGDITKGIGDFFGDVANGIGDFFGGIAQGIGDFFGGLWDGIVEGVKNAIDAVKNVFGSIVNFFKDIISKVLGFFKKLAVNVGNAIGKAFKGVINAVIGAVETILNVPIKAINGLIKVVNKIPGVKLDKLKTFKLPKLATGTNNIETEGIYHLHEGEAVVPKKYNPATGGYDNGADNKQIINLLIDLNASMIALSEREMAVYMDSKKVAEGVYDDIQTITKNKNVSNNVVRS